MHNLMVNLIGIGALSCPQPQGWNEHRVMQGAMETGKMGRCKQE